MAVKDGDNGEMLDVDAELDVLTLRGLNSIKSDDVDIADMHTTGKTERLPEPDRKGLRSSRHSKRIRRGQIVGSRF